MRISSQVVVISRAIGDANEPDSEFQGSVLEAMKWVVRVMETQQLKKRIEFYVARTLDEAKRGFESNKNNILEDSLDDMWSRLNALSEPTTEEIE